MVEVLGKMKMRRFFCVTAVAAALGAQGVTNVFEMPGVYPRHRHLQQQLIQVVRAGQIEEMERICRDGVALLPQDPTWQYNLACALAYRADKSEALEALDRAIELGFRDDAAIASDNDLKHLKGEKRFAELIGKAKRLKGQPVEGVAQVQVTSVVMGLPAEVNAGNTRWDFEAGCFRTLFRLMSPDMKRLSAYAPAYQGPAAESLREWFGDGTASGNFGDLYVNRDGGHSQLDVSKFPGLTPVVYGAEAQKHRAHLSLPNTLFEQPLIGNCSMSMVSGPYWRSLPRSIVTDPFQAIAAFRYYVGNQCWVFPEHRDYDPDPGDLFPVNAPYYVVSQGSSGSDQPFLQAFAATLAAFQPETKRSLILQNRLAPTLQMILRATQKTVREPGGYLTGAAHPVVFDAQSLDVEAMVKMAHALKPEEILPWVALRTLKDAQPEMGRDFFDFRPEGLFDTPCCIARVVRGVSRERRITLEASVPARGTGFEFQWVVLQGDPKKVVIRPLNSAASQVEIAVSYHGRFRVCNEKGEPQAMTSSRVDVGCFVKSGPSYSAPSLVSFYYLPNEERVYRDDGQILSVDYTNAGHRYADPVLTLQKGWKDLYEYDARGRLMGWYRKRGDQTERFTHAGHKVLKTDKLNRPMTACAVQYLPRQTGVAGAPPALTCADTPQVFTYTYADDADQVGKPVATLPK